MSCFWPLDFNNCLTYSKNQFEKVTFIKIKKRKISNRNLEIKNESFCPLPWTDTGKTCL